MKLRNKPKHPKFLFKYREFTKRSIELFINQELWFPSPDLLNDPFDCQTECHRIIASCAKELGKILPARYVNEIKRRVDDELSNIGVISFSRTKKNQLMWSHYADEHKGFCIGFHNDLSMLEDNSLRGFKVKYRAKHPFEDFISENTHFETSRDELKELCSRLLILALKTKYTKWEYEKEWRIVKKHKGTVRFAPEMVNSITFGLKMADQDKRTLQTMLKEKQWRHLKWFETKKAENRFALEFNRIT